MQVVCSLNPRPALDRGGKRGGGQWWKREVHHLAVNGRTLCGRDSSEWLVMDIDLDDAMISKGLCVRCESKAHAR